MSKNQRPLTVTVVSNDTAVLHEVAWVLAAVGYQVQTSKDVGPDALWRRYAVSDFLVLDGRAALEPNAAVFACESDSPVYRIFLYDPATQTDFGAWYAAGANDALRVPVSRGELLTRIRTGARFLEFERRFAGQSAKHSLPGMYSKSGFLRKLRKQAASQESGPLSHTLLFASIDWFDGIRCRNGMSVSRRLVASATRAVKRAAGENAVSAYWGEGCFATLLVGLSVEAARTVSEHLARDFGSRESQSEALTRPTLTIAIVPWTAGDASEKVVVTAMETLTLAKQSGGDCVVEQGSFHRELTAWQNDMATGNPFVNVVAQDIMEPFPALLHCDKDESDMITSLRRSGVPVCPYVDDAGKLVGVASAEKPDENGQPADPSRVASLPISKPETIPFDASFPEIYEAFSTRGCSTLVVVSGEQPLGYLTCDGFLSMIEPIDSTTYMPSDDAPEGIGYLVVGPTSGEPEPEPV
jgi:GGDEF domain-containing protein